MESKKKGVEWHPQWTGADLAKHDALKQQFLKDANLFREIRQELGVSQVAAAKALHTSQANVSKLERRSTVDLNAVRSMAAVAGASVSVVVRTADGRELAYTE